MQEGRDHLLLVQAVFRGEGERIDAAELEILAVADQALDRIHGAPVRRLAQQGKQVFRIAHGGLRQKTSPASGNPTPCRRAVSLTGSGNVEGN